MAAVAPTLFFIIRGMRNIDVAAAYNKGAIAWALVLLLPSNWRLRWWEQVICVLAVWLESMWLDRFKSSIMLVHVLVMAILLIRRNRTIKVSLPGAMQAVFWAWAFTMFSGSVLSIFFPALYGSLRLAVILSTLLLLLAWLWRWMGKTEEQSTGSGIRFYHSVLELAIMAYFSFVVPALQISSSRQASVLILSLLALLALVYAFMRRMNTLSLHYHRMKLEEQEIKRRYLKTIEIRHYIDKLFHLLGADLARKDLDAATRHFEKEIQPLCAELEERREMRVASAKLAKLIGYSLTQLASMKQIRTDIQVQEDAPIVEEDDLCIILNIWLDNAVETLREQEEGFFRLKIKMFRGKKLLIHVANSIENQSGSFEKITQNDEEDRGFGLRIAEKTIRRNTRMQHDSYISSAVDYHKPLFIQQLLVG